MSCFLLPVRHIREMVAATRRFWWSSQKYKGKVNWVSWDRIMNPKDQGGLGIRDFKDFNVALLVKQSWRILQNPNTLLAHVYKAKYYAKTTLLQVPKRRTSCYAWKSILKGSELIKHGLRWIVGNGEKNQVWTDQWLPITPS